MDARKLTPVLYKSGEYSEPLRLLSPGSGFLFIQILSLTVSLQSSCLSLPSAECWDCRSTEEYAGQVSYRGVGWTGDAFQGPDITRTGNWKWEYKCCAGVMEREVQVNPGSEPEEAWNPLGAGVTGGYGLPSKGVGN